MISIQEQLEKISEKDDYITDEAKNAKVQYDAMKETGFYNAPQDVEDIISRDLSEFDQFNDNVKLMMSVFQKSRFEEFWMLLSNPQRLFATQFLSGLFRGMGFCIGGLFIVYLLVYFLSGSALFQQALKTLLTSV